MKNAYYELGIRPSDSFEELEKKLKRFSNISDEELANLLEGKSKEEQRQILLGKLVLANYYALFNAENDEEKKKSYSEAYNMLNTPEKRKKYEKENFQKLFEVENKSRQQEKQKIKQEEISQTPEMQFSERLDKWQQGNCTKDTLTIQELQQLTNKNKMNNDPENQFPNFTGVPYIWYVRANQEVQQLLLDEMNNKQERIIATRLGIFEYGGLLSGPTKEKPSGRYGGLMKGTDIVGIIKLNQDGQVIRNDIVLAKLGKITEENKDFIKNVFFGEDEINRANKENDGFIGRIVENDENSTEYAIDYNAEGDSDMVTALTWANYVKGMIYLDNQGYNMTFQDMKRGFLIAYQNYALSLGEPNKNVLNDEGRDPDE